MARRLLKQRLAAPGANTRAQARHLSLEDGVAVPVDKSYRMKDAAWAGPASRSCIRACPER